MNTANEKLSRSINTTSMMSEEEMYAALTTMEREFLSAGVWMSVAEAYKEAKIRRPLDFQAKKMPMDDLEWRLAQCAPLIQAGKATTEQVLRLSSTTFKNMLPLLLKSDLVTIDSILASEALDILSPHYSFCILILFNILTTEQLNTLSENDAWLSRQIMFLLCNRLIKINELPHYIGNSKLLQAYLSIPQQDLDCLIFEAFNMAKSLPSFIAVTEETKESTIRAILAMTTDAQMSAWYVEQFERSSSLKHGDNRAVDDRFLSHPPAATSQKRAATSAAVTHRQSPLAFTSMTADDENHPTSVLSQQDMYDALTALERELLNCGVWSSIQEAYNDVKINRPDDFRANKKTENALQVRLEQFTPWIKTKDITTEIVLSLSDKTARRILTMLKNSQMVSIESLLTSEELLEHPHYGAYSLLILFNLITPEQLPLFSLEEWLLSQKILCLLMTRLLKPSELPTYLGHLPLVKLYASIPDADFDLLHSLYFNDKQNEYFLQAFDRSKKEMTICHLLAIKTSQQLIEWQEAQCLRLGQVQSVYDAAEDMPEFLPEVEMIKRKAFSVSAAILDANETPLPPLHSSRHSSPTLFPAVAVVASTESEGANEDPPNDSIDPGSHASFLS